MHSTINENGVILTLNNMGHCIPELTEFSQKFVEFSKNSEEPVLDMGAAYGPAAIAALKNNTKVIANDIDPRHLEYLRAAVPEQYRKNLTLSVGRIPGEVHFQPKTFKAIHSSQVLHFLSGDEIEQTAQLMFDWLVPQGKVFIIAGTPYMKVFEKVIPVYEKRRRENDPWPGQINDIEKYCVDPKYLHQIPSFMNFLDPDVLNRTFSKVGFIIEDVRTFKREKLPFYVAYDGRENVGLIGKKPT